MKLASTLALLLLLSACNSTQTTGPRATVQMRDGSRVSGMVLASTAAELRIAGDDGISRTIPMSAVRSVEYGDAPAVDPAAAAPAAAVRTPSPPPRRHGRRPCPR
jgi:hypothetical protein